MTPVESAQVRGALGWSTISTLILRVGTFAVGIVLARLLTPEQFGVFAVALTVQAVLITLADLGLSADLIRTPDPKRIAPTVATFGLAAGAVMTAGMALSAHSVASLLRSPAAGNVIVVLSFTLLLGGAGLVPYSMLQRRFQQKRLFLIAAIDFVVGTTITLLLLWAGWGVMALAVGRVAAQSVTLILQFALSGERPRYGIDRAVVRPVLAFGLPIAAANLLSWALLNIDNVVISRISGPVALGFYFLAFNISSWPMTALGQIVRSVALPTFSRTVVARNDPSLATATSLTWAVAVPAGAFLALLSGPLIAVVYGDKWAAAAPVLAALGLFGAVRAIFDLIVSYLLSRGASREVLAIQVLWFVVLVPATIFGTLRWGIEGAAWAHLAVSLVIVLPAYLIAARRSGADVRLVLKLGWQPVAAMIPAALTVLGATLLLPNDLPALIGGGLAGGAVYLLLIFRWVRARIPARTPTPAPDPIATPNSPVEERNS
ncbi:lipopolysaccharide biosynthesis protein [Cryobacterium arcticum]|uniref:Glycosyl transferase n=1 Tax=Cryobacterium arcticum TaxID=670052 RepID=A0A1B1BN96_9MICO|nr:lipopolysaccharide biosynthesis protein [Cryobacterium arcticum]ANP74099.1 glycosyl transferase [Cryobacterium arcticum]